MSLLPAGAGLTLWFINFLREESPLLSKYPATQPLTSPPTRLPTHPSIHPPTHPPSIIHPPTHSAIHTAIYSPHTHLSTCPFASPYNHLTPIHDTIGHCCAGTTRRELAGNSESEETTLRTSELRVGTDQCSGGTEKG